MAKHISYISYPEKYRMTLYIYLYICVWVRVYAFIIHLIESYFSLDFSGSFLSLFAYSMNTVFRGPIILTIFWFHFKLVIHMMFKLSNSFTESSLPLLTTREIDFAWNLSPLFLHFRVCTDHLTTHDNNRLCKLNTAGTSKQWRANQNCAQKMVLLSRLTNVWLNHQWISVAI